MISVINGGRGRRFGTGPAEAENLQFLSSNFVTQLPPEEVASGHITSLIMVGDDVINCLETTKINKPSEHGMTFLGLAAEQGWLPGVRALVEWDQGASSLGWRAQCP